MIIEELWSRMPGAYFCVSTKTVTGIWEDHYFSKTELRQVKQFLKDNADKNCYFCPHGFNRRSRKGESAAPANILWADLDNANPSGMSPKPTIAFESSPGRYVGLWLIDKPYTKELNRALTYHVGADKGGWDVGQVLRIPGTLNYKYGTHPKVRILWDDGPAYTFDKIARVVKLTEKKNVDQQSHSASEVFARYERRLPVWARKELMRKDKPTAGKRSEILWKLEHAILEAGCDREEAFALIKGSVWNKFKGRPNEDEQIKSELEKIVESRLTTDHTEFVDHLNGYKFLAHSIEEAEERNIDWLWHRRLALGELTIVEGDPGLGKSYFVQSVARHICDGKRLPDSRKSDKFQAARVAYFDLENDQGAVTKPRLQDGGIVNEFNYFQEEMAFSIDNEDALEGVEDALDRLRPALVVFDTLNNYIGSADIHKSSEAQQSMLWFRDIARRFHCSVVVIRHLTKGGRDRAIYRGQGSIAFAGAARIILTIGVHPENEEERVVAVTKMNLAKPPQSLSFRINELPDTSKRQDRSTLEFTGLNDFNSDDILAASSPKKNTDTDDAKKFLEEILGDGEVEGAKVERMAEKRNISARSLKKAADALGVEKQKKGFGKKTVEFWILQSPE